MTIVRSDGGYEVRSERTGRRLSKKRMSKRAAVKRLRQIEYFKHHKERGGKYYVG